MSRTITNKPKKPKKNILQDSGAEIALLCEKADAPSNDKPVEEFSPETKKRIAEAKKLLER